MNWCLPLSFKNITGQCTVYDVKITLVRGVGAKLKVLKSMSAYEWDVQKYTDQKHDVVSHINKWL